MILPMPNIAKCSRLVTAGSSVFDGPCRALPRHCDVVTTRSKCSDCDGTDAHGLTLGCFFKSKRQQTSQHGRQPDRRTCGNFDCLAISDVCIARPCSVARHDDRARSLRTAPSSQRFIPRAGHADSGALVWSILIFNCLLQARLMSEGRVLMHSGLADSPIPKQTPVEPRGSRLHSSAEA